MLHHFKFPADVAAKLDRIALYLTERRVDLPISQRSIREWEDLQEAIGIVEAAKKRLENGN